MAGFEAKHVMIDEDSPLICPSKFLIFSLLQSISMPLLWDNFAAQLDSVRASNSLIESSVPANVAIAELSTRHERLKSALAAAAAAGNQQMMESVQAALENREATMELPSLESGPQAFLKALKAKPFA